MNEDHLNNMKDDESFGLNIIENKTDALGKTTYNINYNWNREEDRGSSRTAVMLHI